MRRTARAIRPTLANMEKIFPRTSSCVCTAARRVSSGCGSFPSPDFDAAARRRWDPQRYYTDPAYYRDPKLVRPYRVGMTCAFCHVGPHPLHPPDDPEKPEWRNLSSNIGAQYFRPSGVFSLPGQEGNFLHQVIASMPPGTVDTSALASDNINNPRNMNALYQVGARLAIGREETLAGGNLDLPGTQAKMPVPHVLKDGADSIGIVGALARVYVSIGAYHQEWLKHFNLVLGGKRQTPFPVGEGAARYPVLPRHAGSPAGRRGVFRQGRDAASAGARAGRRAFSAGQQRNGCARPAGVRRELRRLSFRQAAGHDNRARYAGMGRVGPHR